MKKLVLLFALFVGVVVLNSCEAESVDSTEEYYDAIEKGTPIPKNGVEKGTPPPGNG